MKTALIEIAAELMQFPSDEPVSRRVLVVAEIYNMEEQDSLIAKCQKQLKEGEVMAIKGGLTYSEDEYDANDRQQDSL